MEIVLNIFFLYKSDPAFINWFAFVKMENIAEDQRENMSIHLTLYFKSSEAVHLKFICYTLNVIEITGRKHSPTHQQKIGLKIYQAWPHPLEHESVSPTVSLSHQEAS